MRKLHFAVTVAGFATLASAAVLAADNRQEKKLTVAPGAAVNIVNNDGSVSLHPGQGQQVVISYTTHSNKIEVDPTVTPDGKRVEIITHSLPQQKPTPEEASVEYDITVPAGASVTVRTATAPVTADGTNGELSLASDTGEITVRNVNKAHIRIRSVAAPVELSNISAGDIEITAAGGNVHMVDVAGPRVSVGTTSGNINYQGDVSGGGDYDMTTHSGMINVILPESASFDLEARSVRGSVENDFPLKQKSHTTFTPTPGRSFAGTSHSGSSSVELQSFSGRIRVKKQ